MNAPVWFQRFIYQYWQPLLFYAFWAYILNLSLIPAVLSGLAARYLWTTKVEPWAYDLWSRYGHNSSDVYRDSDTSWK